MTEKRMYKKNRDDNAMNCLTKVLSIIGMVHTKKTFVFFEIKNKQTNKQTRKSSLCSLKSLMVQP